VNEYIQAYAYIHIQYYNINYSRTAERHVCCVLLIVKFQLCQGLVLNHRKRHQFLVSAIVVNIIMNFQMLKAK